VPTGASPESSNAVLGSYNTVNTLTPGNGYFVKTNSGTTNLNYSGNPGPASFTVVLKPGWTMIANPQAGNSMNIASNWLVDGAPLGTAIVNGQIGGGIYWWNGTTYDSWSIVNDYPQIEPWKGYWMLNLDSISHVLTIQGPSIDSSSELDAGAVYGQVSSGSVKVKGAQVALHAKGIVIATATTDANGSFYIGDLDAGTYSVTVSANGYSPYTGTASVALFAATLANCSLQSMQ